MKIPICDDVLLEIFNFLPRKQLSKLEECCWNFHNLVSNDDGHCPSVLHIVRAKLIVKLWSLASTDTSASNTIRGLFVLTEYVCDEIHPQPERIVRNN